MRLAQVAKYFDKVLCQDAFNLSSYFYGQLDLYDDSRRDGATVVRRILSVANDVVIPARRVLLIHGDYWLVGMHEADSYRGEVIRDKHVLHHAQGPCTIATPAQALTTGGVSSYGSKLWVKDMKELEVSSKLTSFYNIYLPSTEDVERGQVITLGGRVHLVRNTFVSAAGFRVAEGDELEEAAIVAGTFYPQVYAPATDSRTDGAGVALNVLRFRFQDNYAYTAESAEKFVSGDIRAMIAKGLTAAEPAPTDRLALPDGSWSVVSVSDEGTSWGLHLRRTPG
jgi:hypothetical protein